MLTNKNGWTLEEQELYLGALITNHGCGFALALDENGHSYKHCVQATRLTSSGGSHSVFGNGNTLEAAMKKVIKSVYKV